MFSHRFQLPIVITETGVDRDGGAGHHWLYKHYLDRNDNLHCVAAVVDNVFVLKTVMHD